MIDGKEEYRKMADAEGSLWWYRILHKLTHEAIQRRFADDTAIRILDLGCGTGGMMQYLKDRGYQNIQGIDLSEEAVRISKERSLNVSCGDMLSVSKFVGQDEMDVIISNDTLYFIPENDRPEYLQVLASRLKENGLLITNLPAMKEFSGMHDQSVGIEKRFERDQVNVMFSQTEFTVLGQRFWPFVLSPMIFIARAQQRRKMLKKPQVPVTSDVGVPPFLVNQCLYLATLAEVSLIRSGPFASSLFVVSQRKSPS